MKQSESRLFLRTNNACEGYNNRLRSQIKYYRTPLGYVIKKLIEEEAIFREETLNILTRKKQKNSAPNHLKDLAINMPIDHFINDLLKLFKGNKELGKFLNNEKTTIDDIKPFIQLDYANELINIIIKNIFEEDVSEEIIEKEEVNEKKYDFKIKFVNYKNH